MMMMMVVVVMGSLVRTVGEDIVDTVSGDDGVM